MSSDLQPCVLSQAAWCFASLHIWRSLDAFLMLAAHAHCSRGCRADETVSSELKKQIMSARLAKKLTQAQLANLINEKPQVIQEYESGKVSQKQRRVGLQGLVGLPLFKRPWHRYALHAPIWSARPSPALCSFHA